MGITQNCWMLNLVVRIVTTMTYKVDLFIAYLEFIDNLKAILQIWPKHTFPQSGPTSFHSKPLICLPFLPTWQLSLGPKHVVDLKPNKLILVFDWIHWDSFILKTQGSSETSVNTYQLTYIVHSPTNALSLNLEKFKLT